MTSTTAPSGACQSRRAGGGRSSTRLGIAVVLVIGTVGFNLVGGTRWVDAFYMESMLATGQGPPVQLTTDAGKIFAPIMGFVSVGSVITGLVFTMVPIISQLWRESLERMEFEARHLESELGGRKDGMPSA